MTRWLRGMGILLSFGALALAAVAQEATTWPIDKMKVAIWPEYDDPRVFVTYRGTLAPDVSIPYEMRLILPTTADVSHTCSLTPAGEHKCELPRFSNIAEGREVRYTLTTREFLVEAYVELPKTGEARDLEYVVYAPIPTREVEIEVQKPYRAVNFVVEPTGERTWTDSRGFHYQTQIYKDVRPGEPIKTVIRYEKPDDRPSIRADQGQASGGQGGSSSKSAMSRTGSIVAIVMGALIIAALGLYWVRSGNGRGEANVPPRRRARPAKNGGGGPRKAKFCPNCGERVSPQDRFCTSCGQALK